MSRKTKLKNLYKGMIPQGAIVLSFSVIWFFLSHGLVKAQDLATADSIKIMAVHFPPFEFENPENGLMGFDVETVEEAFARKGVKAKVYFTPWARAVEMGKKGLAAGVLSCAKNTEREAYFALSRPISFATRGYTALTSKKFDEINTIIDAENYKVGAVIGYASSKYLTNAGIEHDLSPSDSTALKKLKSGRIELFYSEINATRYMAREAIPGVSLKYYPIEEKPYHLCVSRSWPGSAELLRLFNEGLDEIKADGTFDAIHAKYR